MRPLTMRGRVFFLIVIAGCGHDVASIPDASGTSSDSGTEYTLTVTASGAGTITSTPAGIDCSGTSGACTAAFAANAAITLTATPDANSSFDGWSGSCSGSSTTCSVTLDGSTTVNASFLTPGTRRWISPISSLGVRHLALDPQDNIVVAGGAQDADGDVIVVTKYAHSDGAVLWQRKFEFGLAHSTDVGGLDTDANGNAYICARFGKTGTYNFDGKTVTGDELGNLVVLRLAAATGSIDWATTWGSPSQDMCSNLVVAGNDLIVVGDTLSTSISFDSITVSNVTSFDRVLVRASTATGIASQAIRLHGNIYINDVAVNTSGTSFAIVGGAQEMNATFGSCTVPVTDTDWSSDNAFIAQFDVATLACQWSRVGGSAATNEQAANEGVVALPNNGGWTTAGSYRGTSTFETTSLANSNGSFDAYLVSYDAAGTLRFATAYPGTKSWSVGLSIAPDGSLIWGGHIDHDVSLGTFQLTGTDDVFLVRMSPGINPPTPVYARSLGGPSFLWGLRTDAQGNALVLGSFSQATTVDGVQLTAPGAHGYLASFAL